jgi:signal transduction histidine kinase
VAIGGDVFKIPIESRSRIFTPYLDGKNEVFGTIGHGVGLALAKVVVELHGGSIDVEDAPSSGSVFIVEFTSCNPPKHPRSSKQ